MAASRRGWQLPREHSGVRTGQVTEAGRLQPPYEKRQTVRREWHRRQSWAGSVSVGATQTADLAELTDLIEGLRAAADTSSASAVRCRLFRGACGSSRGSILPEG